MQRMMQITNAIRAGRAFVELFADVYKRIHGKVGIPEGYYILPDDEE
jgi:hypothetical protein